MGWSQNELRRRISAKAYIVSIKLSGHKLSFEARQRITREPTVVVFLQLDHALIFFHWKAKWDRAEDDRSLRCIQVLVVVEAWYFVGTLVALSPKIVDLVSRKKLL